MEEKKKYAVHLISFNLGKSRILRCFFWDLCSQNDSQKPGFGFFGIPIWKLIITFQIGAGGSLWLQTVFKDINKLWLLIQMF